MDPTATWEMVMQHVGTGELHEARMSAADLASWLDGGGYAPEQLRGLKRPEIVQLVESMCDLCGDCVTGFNIWRSI